MSDKNLFVYNSDTLFEILSEINQNLNFEIKNIDKKNFQELNLENSKNNLVITTNSCDDLKNCLKLDNLPQKISQIIEKIKLNFLKKKFIDQSKIIIGKYILNLNSRRLYFENTSLDLTEKESALLVFINSNKKVSLRSIQKNVWNYSFDLETHTVETHIYRLRKKIFKSFKDKNFIKHDKEGYYF